jgi:hypothetical protein
MSAGGALAVPLKHLLFLCLHTAPVKFLKDVVFDIRILLHCRWLLGKRGAWLINVVGWDAASALGLDLHLARLGLAHRHLLFLLVDRGVAALAAARPIVLLLFVGALGALGIGVLCHRRSASVYWLVPLTQNLGVVLIFVELTLVLARVGGAWLFILIWSPLVKVVNRRAARLLVPHLLTWLDCIDVRVLLLLKIAGRLRPLLRLALDVPRLRPRVRHMLSRVLFAISIILVLITHVIGVLNYVAVLLVARVHRLGLAGSYTPLLTRRWLHLLGRRCCGVHATLILGGAARQTEIV